MHGINYVILNSAWYHLSPARTEKLRQMQMVAGDDSTESESDSPLFSTGVK